MIVSPIIEADFDAKVPFVERLVALGHELEVKRVIEFGCGYGKEAALLQAKTGWDVLATDASPEMLQRGPGQVRRETVDVTQVLPATFRGGFQLAYCAFLLHLLPEDARPKFISNCFQATEPNGLFVCLTASEEDLQRRFLAQYFPSALRIDMERYRTVEENLEALERGGFAEVRSESIELGTVVVDLEFYRRRLSSILRLIPEDEYLSGMARMEADVQSAERPTRRWRRTLLIARKRRMR